MHFTPGLQSAICVFIFLQISELALMKWAEKITRKIANKYLQSKHDSICHVTQGILQRQRNPWLT